LAMRSSRWPSALSTRRPETRRTLARFCRDPWCGTDKSRGRRIMLSSRHCDAIMTHQDVFQGEGSGSTSGMARRLPCYAKCCVGSLIEMQQNPQYWISTTT
jgi:hypothetical protein